MQGYPRIQLLDMVDDVIETDSESVVVLTLNEQNYTDPEWKNPDGYDRLVNPPRPPRLKAVLNGTTTKLLSQGMVNFTDLTINRVCRHVSYNIDWAVSVRSCVIALVIICLITVSSLCFVSSPA